MQIGHALIITLSPILKWQLPTGIKAFTAELKRLYPGTQTWDQLMDLVAKQEVNLDGDSNDVYQTFSAARGRLNPYRISQSEWKRSLGAAREFNATIPVFMWHSRQFHMPN